MPYVSVRKAVSVCNLNETVLDANMKSAHVLHFFLLIEEYNRIRNLYSSTKDTLEKAKYKNILLDVIAQDG